MQETKLDYPLQDYNKLILKIKKLGINPINYTLAEKYLRLYSYDILIGEARNSNFFDIQSNKFIYKNINIEDLVNLHIFNCKLKSILLTNILHVERAFKEVLSFEIGINYGVITDMNSNKTDIANDYLYFNNYSNQKGRRGKVLRKLKETITNPDAHQTNVIKCKKKTNLPPYKLANDLYFTTTIDWYSILHDEIKSNVCFYFFENKTTTSAMKSFFINSLKLINSCRNVCAHSSTLVGFKSKSILHYEYLNKSNTLNNKTISEKEFKSFFGKNDIYAVILSLLVFLDDLLAFSLIEDLVLLIENFSASKHTDISFILKSFNLPYDICSRLLIQKDDIITRIISN